MEDVARKIKGYRWEVKGLGEWIKKLRAEPMPDIKLTGKLQGLDMVKDLEYRQKVIQDYLDELEKG